MSSDVGKNALDVVKSSMDAIKKACKDNPTSPGTIMKLINLNVNKPVVVAYVQQLVTLVSSMGDEILDLKQTSQVSAGTPNPSTPHEGPKKEKALDKICEFIKEREEKECSRGLSGGPCSLEHPVLCEDPICALGRRQVECTNWHTTCKLSKLQEVRQARKEEKKRLRADVKQRPLHKNTLSDRGCL